MKKAFTILLLIVCLFQAGGIFLIYRIHQGVTHYRIEMNHHRDINSVCEFQFSTMEYNQLKQNSRELCRNGQMYDIVKTEVFGDSVKITAVRDLREEHILASIKKMLIPDSHRSKSTSISLAKLFLFVYILPNHVKTIFLDENLTNYYKPFHIIFDSLMNDQPCPPPKLLLV